MGFLSVRESWHLPIPGADPGGTIGVIAPSKKNLTYSS